MLSPITPAWRGGIKGAGRKVGMLRSIMEAWSVDTSAMLT